ncbi:hypothetical protein CsatB_028150 [Cannabis sativa]
MESESKSKVPSVVEKVEPATKAKGRPKKTSRKAKDPSVEEEKPVEVETRKSPRKSKADNVVEDIPLKAPTRRSPWKLKKLKVMLLILFLTNTVVKKSVRRLLMSFKQSVMMIFRLRRLWRKLFQARKGRMLVMTLVRQRKAKLRMRWRILIWIKCVNLMLLMMRNWLMLLRK